MINSVDISHANIQPLVMNEGSISGASGLGVAFVHKNENGKNQVYILKYATNNSTSVIGAPASSSSRSGRKPRREVAGLM